jgi:phage terminase large subunit-like protein
LPAAVTPSPVDLAGAATLVKLRRQPRPVWTPRPSQVPPAWPWSIWLLMAGRGFGKTRVGAEWVIEQSRTHDLVNIIAATADDARDICIEGESGIMNVARGYWHPHYQPSRRRLVWPNGNKSLIFTADEPERLRGKQHRGLWADELGAWRFPEAWDQAMFGLRLGSHPQAVVTTTPRVTPVIKDLLSRDGLDVAVTRGTTYENRENLAPSFYSSIIRKYEGTRLGRKELNAEILDDVPGALWTRERIVPVSAVPDLRRVVVAIDPAGTSDEGADETGIVVAGVGVDGHGYVIADRSARLSPDGWAHRAVAAYDEFKADKIVAETNYGGDMVISTIRTVRPRINVQKVTASRGKAIRAEPVAALYEQGRVYHHGSLPELEDQMCQWTPLDGTSPDRLDALVWALTDLMVGAQPIRLRAL